MIRKLIVLSLFLALVSSSYAAYVLGNFEDSNDGWGGWVSNAVTPNPNMTNGNSVGVTLDSGSGFIPLSGWSQALARDLSYAERVELSANNKFSMDFATGSVGTGGGAWIVESVTINTQGGYNFDNPFSFGYGVASQDSWGGAAIGRPIHIDVNYDPSLINGGEVPGWCQIIITLNGYDTAQDFYFDNAVLTPEPMTIALLGLGGLFLRRRR